MNNSNNKAPKTIPQRLLFLVLATVMIGQAYYLPQLWEAITTALTSAVASIFIGLALASILIVACGVVWAVEAFTKKWL